MRDKAEFLENLKRLGDYFGIKITKEIARAYYDQLYYIKSAAFQDICTKIISDRKPFKSQFPTITQFGPLYETHTPAGETKQFTQTKCDECHGQGLIYFKYWHFKHGITYESHVACGMCGNWKQWYSTLDSHGVFADGQFMYRHPGIEQSTRDELELKRGVVEISKDGRFEMTDQEISDHVLTLYGDRERGIG